MIFSATMVYIPARVVLRPLNLSVCVGDCELRHRGDERTPKKSSDRTGPSDPIVFLTL